MRLLGIDFETTGFDITKERITEIGTVLWNVEEKHPIILEGIYLYDAGIEAKCQDPEICKMMKRVSGITPEYLREFGLDPRTKLQELEKFVSDHRVDYVVAHSGTDFDRPIMLSELDRHEVPAPALRAVSWIDTRTDIPFAEEPDSRKLKYMAADHEIINPFPHRAVYDVTTMLKLLSKYDIDKVLAYRNTPTVRIRAMTAHPRIDGGASNTRAKNIGYRWDPAGVMWYKTVKEDQVENEKEIAKKNSVEVRIVSP